MDRNFELRREIFGDEVIDAANLRMVEIAKSFGGKLPTLHLQSLRVQQMCCCMPSSNIL